MKKLINIGMILLLFAINVIFAIILLLVLAGIYFEPLQLTVFEVKMTPLIYLFVDNKWLVISLSVLVHICSWFLRKDHKKERAETRYANKILLDAGKQPIPE